MSKKATFTDTTPFDEHKDQSIDELSESIGGDHAKVYPRDTFWAIKQLIGLHGKVAANANALSTDAKAMSQDTQARFDDQINGKVEPNEVIDARRPVSGDAYQTLGKRLDGMTADTTAKFANQYANPVEQKLFTLRSGEKNVYDQLPAFQDFVTENPKGAIAFPSGTFVFNNPVTFSGTFSIQMMPATIITVADDWTDDTLWTWTGASTNDRGTFISGNGATLNLLAKAGTAFHFENMAGVTIQNLKINDCNKSMISATGAGHDLIVTNLRGQNLIEKPDGVALNDVLGVYCEWSDNAFSDCVFVNVSVGFYLMAQANDLSHCHVWCVDKYIPISTAFVSKGGWARFSYCISDTCQTGFEISTMAFLDHCRIMSNSAYESFMQKNPVGILLTSPDDLSMLNITSTMFQNAYINLSLEPLSPAIVANSTTWSKLYTAGNYYSGRKTGTIPELSETITSGKFNPTFYGSLVAGAVKYDSAVGRYKRVGNAVFVNISLQVELDDKISGNYSIGNLPFPNGTLETCLTIGWRSSSASSQQLITAMRGLTCNLNPGKDWCELLYSPDYSEVPKNVATDNLKTGYIMLNISGCYFID